MDAAPLGIRRRLPLHRLTVKANLAFVRQICARHHFHERGLTRTVFADQGVDFSSAHAERDRIKTLDARKALGHLQHLDPVSNGSLVRGRGNGLLAVHFSPGNLTLNVDGL